jgi:hypothetical protein
MQPRSGRRAEPANSERGPVKKKPRQGDDGASGREAEVHARTELIPAT